MYSLWNKWSHITLTTLTTYLKVKVIWRSRSFDIKVTTSQMTKMPIYFKCYCDLCVTWRYAFDWKAFLFSYHLLSVDSFYHLHMQIGITFSQVWLSVSLSVYMFVCLSLQGITFKALKPVYIQNIDLSRKVNFLVSRSLGQVQGQMNKMSYFISPLLLFVVFHQSFLKDNDHMNIQVTQCRDRIKIKWKDINFLSIYMCLGSLCSEDAMPSTERCPCIGSVCAIFGILFETNYARFVISFPA